MRRGLAALAVIAAAAAPVAGDAAAAASDVVDFLTRAGHLAAAAAAAREFADALAKEREALVLTERAARRTLEDARARIARLDELLFAAGQETRRACAAGDAAACAAATDAFEADQLLDGLELRSCWRVHRGAPDGIEVEAHVYFEAPVERAAREAAARHLCAASNFASNCRPAENLAALDYFSKTDDK